MWVNEADEDRSVGEDKCSVGVVGCIERATLCASVVFYKGTTTIHMGVEFETPAETTQKKKKWIMGEEEE